MSAMAVEPEKNKTRLSQLDQLKKFSKVVADTGDFESMRKYQPQDATTNPSLIYAATQQEQYVHLLDEVIVDRKRSGLAGAAQIEDIIEHLLVKFGCEMLKIVPGRVSTETDARYSFDVEGSIKKARQLVKIYEERGIPRERVLIKIASTWEGSVPGPILHLRQGQTLNVTFVNNGTMQHSIDFHAAQVAPDIAYRSINPGEKLDFSFVAATPGAFIYHCGTPPVLQHMANGMYGAIIVDPAEPMPPADVSYVLVESEWYTAQAEGTVMSGDYNKMLSVTPDEVVFNGIAFQYNDHPLAAKVGQRVRLYVIDAGPNLMSAFHIIGGMFAAVYPDGDPKHALSGVSTYPVAPGQGVVFDAIMSPPGKYPIVDHSMRSMTIGTAGVLSVAP